MMNPSKTPPTEAADSRSVSVMMLKEMLASLQEAIVTENKDDRRALLKGVIGRFQELLGKETRR